MRQPYYTLQVSGRYALKLARVLTGHLIVKASQLNVLRRYEDTFNNGSTKRLSSDTIAKRSALKEEIRWLNSGKP